MAASGSRPRADLGAPTPSCRTGASLLPLQTPLLLLGPKMSSVVGQCLGRMDLMGINKLLGSSVLPARTSPSPTLRQY